jgi:hypothetical protein
MAIYCATGRPDRGQIDLWLRPTAKTGPTKSQSRLRLSATSKIDRSLRRGRNGGGWGGGARARPHGRLAESNAIPSKGEKAFARPTDCVLRLRGEVIAG